jgi:hypothetical protein
MLLGEAVALDPRVDWLALAAREGVLPMLETRLQQASDGCALPQALREGVQAGVRQAKALELYRRHELARIAAVLANARLRVLLLKGNALCLWLYPQPHLRPTRDIDLLFASREELAHAVQLLAPLGYVAEPDPGRLFFERKCQLRVDGHIRCELDLHWKLLNSPLFADSLPFDELWSASQALPGLPVQMRALAPVHALLHACLNRVLDIPTGEPERLKLLFDVHLLAGRLTASDWAQLQALACQRQIAGGCLHVFGEAQAMLGTVFPATLLSVLSAAASREPLDWTRLRDWRYMQWRSVLAVPARLRMRWLYERLFPTGSRMRGRYGPGSWGQLMIRRLRRGLTLLCKRSADVPAKAGSDGETT